MPGERLVHPGQKVVVLSNVSKFTPLLERFARLDCGLRTEVVLQLLVACESTCTWDLGCIGCLNAGCCFSEIRVSVSYLVYELSMDNICRVERVLFYFFFKIQNYLSKILFSSIPSCCPMTLQMIKGLM